MNDSAQGSWSAIAGVTLLTAAIGSIFFVDGPLESRRPHRDATHVPSSNAETVPARLWQDPVEVIQADWNRIVSHMASEDRIPAQSALPGTLRELGRYAAATDLPGPQLWLLAMVSGKPYADDVEHRRRDRYAIVTALTDRNFEPDRPDRIGYAVGPGFASPRRNPSVMANVDWSSPVAISRTTHVQPRHGGCPDDVHPSNAHPSEVAAKCTVLVGFERYGRASGAPGGAYSSVVVLWLNADDFKDYPLQRVAALVAVLRSAQTESTGASQPTAVLLGPPTSEMLERMLLDQSERATALAEAESFVAHAQAYESTRQLLTTGSPDVSVPCCLRDIEDGLSDLNILSTRSTVPLDILFDQESARIRAVRDAPLVEERLARAFGVSTFRSVVARDDIVLQGVVQELADRGACRSGKRVGLALIAERDSVYGRRFKEIVTRERESLEISCHFEVEAYGYLKGVDGEASRRGRVDNDGGDADRGVLPPLLPPTEHFEPPHGDAQLDYLRRLADLIGRDFSAGGYDHFVVGVLGADIYDKQLVLQALRERLPPATYFTTDLDARLHDPVAKRSTRNLIVGSAHGLGVSGRARAVFRDSYQTATYLAADLAVSSGPPPFAPCVGRPEHRGCNPLPRLFEIGLSKTVDITRSHAAVANARSQSLAALLLLAPLLGLMLVALTSRGRLRPSSETSKLSTAYLDIVAAAGAAAVVLFGLVFYAAQPGREPAEYLEGVSSVPALVLEVTTAVFALSIALIVRARLHCADEALFDLVGGRDGLFHRVDDGPADKAVFRKYCVPVPLLKEDSGKGDKTLAQVLWAYAENRSSRRWVPWTVGRFLGTATFVLAFMWAQDGPLLARGLDLLAAVCHAAMLLAVVACICFWSYCVNVDRSLIRQLARNRLCDLADLVVTAEARGLSDASRQCGYVMDLVVQRTRTVGALIVLPFLLFPLMMLSRSTVFEGWVWTKWQLALYAAIAAYVLIQALGYQREASAARARILDDLQQHSLNAEANRTQRRIARDVIEKMLRIRDGAFSPWTRHPLLQSLALPLGGLALVALLDFLF